MEAAGPDGATVTAGVGVGAGVGMGAGAGVAVEAAVGTAAWVGAAAGVAVAAGEEPQPAMTAITARTATPQHPRARLAEDCLERAVRRAPTLMAVSSGHGEHVRAALARPNSAATRPAAERLRRS